MKVLLVCTGNVARSVMARSMLECLAEAEGLPLRLATAGTHAVEGQPAGVRTQAALRTVLGEVSVGRHRSRQLSADDLAPAQLVVAMEGAHVRYVRRHHPEAAPRTGTLRHLCRALDPGPPDLATRVAGLDLGAATLADSDDVADPAGGSDATYADCATELWVLCQELAARL